jgi:hypothetical protein
MFDTRRITLVSRRPDVPARAWDLSAKAANRIIIVDIFSLLRYALDHVSQDVDRVLIDGAATPAEFLDLLTVLPSAFLGDVLLIRDDGSAFLSTVGRADGRLLYALNESDVQFYLEAHELVKQKPAADALAATGEVRAMALTTEPLPCYL